ncbi:MAG: TolC family protein [Parasulfuritortus sp.]|nr:TolC family protein [Parasulfuritortus sp.]
MKRLTLAAGLFVMATTAAATSKLENLTLEQAVQIALQNHRSLQVSQAALDMAEAQYQQAMGAFRPHVGFDAGVQRADQNRTYTFSGTIMTPATDATGLVNYITHSSLPANSVVIPSQPMTIDMTTELFARDTAQASLDLTYPLYTGGKQDAVIGMAKKGVAVAREEKRKTELEVVHDVQKYYNGAVFAGQMEQLASDTLERFQALEDLTDRLYQNASLKVKKTDFLRSKTTTAMTRSMVDEAKYASALSREALANAMGLPVNSELTLAPEAPLPAFNADLDTLISDAMKFNPDKQRLELAVQIADDRINEARSDSRPTIGLDANTYHVFNKYKDGLFNADNRTGWTLGVGLKWSLFDGGMAKAATDAARAGKIKLEAQRVLLDNGLALQVKNDFLRIQRSRAQVEDSTKAESYAEENRQLNVRAYQEEMVETKDVIEAQLIEAFASAGVFNARHELRDALADLDYQVGMALQAKP